VGRAQEKGQARVGYVGKERKKEEEGWALRGKAGREGFDIFQLLSFLEFAS
jgi:hypothetical protein